MKKRHGTNISARDNVPQGANDRIARLMEWGMIAMLAVVTLAILPDVNDSTLLKPYALYAGCAVLFALGLYWVGAQERVAFSFSMIHASLLAFFLVLVLSLFNAHSISLGLSALSFHACFLFLAITAAYLYSNGIAEQRLQYSLMVIAGLTCIVGFVQASEALAGTVTILASGRDVISTLGNATYYGGLLALLLPLALANLVTAKKLFHRVLMVALFGSLCFMLIRTETRSSWIAAFIGVVIFALYTIRNNKAKWGAIALIVIAIAAAALVFPDIIIKRLSGMFEMSAHSSFSRRLFFYEGAWNAFLSSPALGNGVGNFIIFLPKFRSPDYWMYQSEDIVPHAHNEFLEIASESGALGLGAFMFILGVVFIAVNKRFRATQGSERVMIAGYIAAIISVLVDNLFSLNLRTMPVAAIFWLILGVACRNETRVLIEKTFTIPSLLRRFRFLPLAVCALFLVLLFSFAQTTYHVERAVVEGNIATWQHQEDLAIEKYEQAVAMDSTHPLASYLLAAGYVQKQQYREAYAQILRHIRLYPYNPKIYLVAALSSFELGDTAGAIRYIRKELEIARSPQVYYYYAYFASEAGNNNQERELLFSMLNQNIRGVSTEFAEPAIKRLSYICDTDSLRGQYLLLLQRITATFSQNPEILLTAAEAYMRLEKRPEAGALVKLIEALPPANEEARARLAQLKAQLSENSGGTMGN